MSIITEPPAAEPRTLPTPPATKTPPLTVIAAGTIVEGRVDVAGDLRVDGRVEGRALATAAGCEISRDGAVAVDAVRALSLVVHGAVRADEVVARRVVVTATGSLVARVLAAESLDVETGGVLDAALEVGA